MARLPRRRGAFPPAVFAAALIVFSAACGASPGGVEDGAVPTPEPPAPQTDASITATGILVRSRAAREEQLTFGTGGTVGTVSVTEGDSVQKGQELARLDAATIAALTRSVSQAKVAVDNARELYEEPQRPFTAADIAQAELNVASARVGLQRAEESLSDLLDVPTARALADREARVRDARVALENALSALDQARIAWDGRKEVAQDRFDDAQKLYTEVYKRWFGVDLLFHEVNLKPEDLLALWEVDLDTLFVQTPGSQSFNFYDESMPEGGLLPDDPGTRWDESVIHVWANLYPGRVVPQCEDSPPVTGELCVKLELESAWNVFRPAREAVETVKLQAVDALELSENRITNAQKALSDALDAVEELKRGKDLDIEEASRRVERSQVALADALEDLQDTLKGPDAAEVELQRTTLLETQQALEEATEDLENAVLVAPFAGVVSRLNLEAGDAAGPNDAVLRLVDPTDLEVQATVDEAELPRIREGQEVRVLIDALPGTTVTGRLSSISPVPVRQSGIVVRRITVALESAPGMALREGMTGLVMITPVS